MWLVEQLLRKGNVSIYDFFIKSSFHKNNILFIYQSLGIIIKGKSVLFNVILRSKITEVIDLVCS